LIILAIEIPISAEERRNLASLSQYPAIKPGERSKAQYIRINLPKLCGTSHTMCQNQKLRTAAPRLAERHLSPPTQRRALVFPERQSPGCARHNPRSSAMANLVEEAILRMPRVLRRAAPGRLTGRRE
jgi:hypothetical protein